MKLIFEDWNGEKSKIRVEEKFLPITLNKLLRDDSVAKITIEKDKPSAKV